MKSMTNEKREASKEATMQMAGGQKREGRGEVEEGSGREGMDGEEKRNVR